MIKHLELIRSAFKNKVIHYISSRYVTYFIQFINSLLIAKHLGPYYLGVWGFITLIIQYLNQINLGIPHSTNAIISIHKKKEWYVEKVIGSSLTMIIGLSIILIICFVGNYLFNINLGAKYSFNTYAPAVLLIGILAYFNTIFSGIYRVYGKLFEIAFNQTSYPVITLVTILLYKGKNLIWALVLAYLFAFLLSFILYIYRSPVKIKPILICRLIKKIQIKGWHLFLYNTSFYLIMISTKSFISAYYPIEEFGYFTFAFALANVALLLLQSFSFLIQPKLLNRFASASIESISKILNLVRDAYITTSHLLIHIVILIIPIFLTFFPQYHASKDAFRIIALTVVLYTNSFGYSGVLISKGKERNLGLIAIFALIINVLLLYFLINYLHVSFNKAVISTICAYFLYVLLVGVHSNSILYYRLSFSNYFFKIFSIKLFIPYFTSLFLALSSSHDYYFIIPIILFIIFNRKSFKHIKKILQDIVLRPHLINI